MSVSVVARHSRTVLEGSVFSQTADTLKIAKGDVVMVVPTSSVVAMEVASGRLGLTLKF